MSQSDNTNSKQSPNGFVSLSTSLKDPLHRFHRLLETTLSHCTSRRDLLRILGGASATIPLWGPLARAATSFSFDADDTNARFSLNGIPLCHLRTDCFDGKPKLLVRKEEGRFAIRLVQAVFPGTNLPADLILAGSRTAVGWESRLRIASLQFDATFPFEQWLIGQPVARSPVTFPSALATEQGTTVNTRNGTGTVLYPDWTIQLQGADSATVTSAVGEISGDEVQIELMPSEASPILLANMKRPHTRIWVKGKKLTPASIEIEPVQVSFSTERLTALVELQRTADGDVHSASSFEGTSHSVPVGQIALGSQDPTQAVPARQMCVTLTGACDDQKVTVRADLVRNCAWVKKGDIYAELVLCEEGKPFHAEKNRGSECRASNNARVARIIAPLSGVDDAQFVRRHAKTKGDGSYDLCQVPHDSVLDGLHWLNGFHPFSREIPLDQFDLNLRRGQDGFVCTVRFHNIDLMSSLWSGLTLVASSRNQPPASLIEFDFGPQHVQEEALYITEIGQDKQDSERYFSDELILKYHPSNYPNKMVMTCEKLVKARQGDLKEFKEIRKAAYNKYREVIEATSAKNTKSNAHARFSQSSWLTFKLCSTADCEPSLPFTLDALLCWTQPPTDPSKELLKLEIPKLAAPLNEKLIEQVTTLRNASTSPLRPRSLAEGSAQAATLIQAPYRLGLAPIGNPPEWKATQAFGKTQQMPVELWNLKAEKVLMRVVWSPDFEGKEFWASCYPHWPSKGPINKHGGAGFRASLDARDRHELVALSSGFGQPSLLGSGQVLPIIDNRLQKEIGIKDPLREGLFIPKPINAALVMLTSLGATAKLLGVWSPPANDSGGALTIQRWDHKAQIGRDVKVVVEYKGFLFPIGHPAVLVKETERHLILDTKRHMVARLVQRFFIRVPAFARSFPATGQPFESRAWPFSKLVAEEFITPDLDDPAEGNPPIVPGLGQQAFWPEVNKVLVQFPFFDQASKVHFSTPLVFVDNQVSHSPDMLKAVARAYRISVDKIQGQPKGNQTSQLKASEPSKCIATVTSGAISWGPPAKPGDTEYSTIRFLLDVDVPSPTKENAIISKAPLHKECDDDRTFKPCLPTDELSQPDGQDWEDVLSKDNKEAFQRAFKVSPTMEAENQPPFYPHIRQALIGTEQLSKVSGQPRGTTLVEFDGGYLRDGFSPTSNPGEVFLRLVDGGVTLSFSSNSSAAGGFASPTTGIAAISRRNGPIGGDTSQCLPQVAFYRRIPESANALKRESDEIKKLRELRKLGFRDPVSKSRVGDFDPKEFFAQTMGDAKLLGVVRLVDIIDVALKASGTTMPEIIQDVTDFVSSEAAPRISAAVLHFTNDQKIRSATSEVPRLARAMAILRARAEALQQASGDSTKAIAIGAELVRAAREFGDAVRAVADDPRQLLPPDAQQFLTSLDTARTALEPLLTGKVFERYLDGIRQELLDALEQELNAIIQEVHQHPVFGEVQKLAEAASGEIQDLRQRLFIGAQHELMHVIEGIPRVLSPLVELVKRVGKDFEEFCKNISAIFGNLSRDLIERAEEKGAPLYEIKEAAIGIKKKVDDIRKLCDSGARAAPELKQLCEQLAGLAIGITGAIEGMDRLRQVEATKFEHPCPDSKQNLLIHPQLVEAYWATVRDILRKAQQLTMLLPEPDAPLAAHPKDKSQTGSGCSISHDLANLLDLERFKDLERELKNVRSEVNSYVAKLIRLVNKSLEKHKLPGFEEVQEFLEKIPSESDTIGYICKQASKIQGYERLFAVASAILTSPNAIQTLRSRISSGVEKRFSKVPGYEGPAYMVLSSMCSGIAKVAEALLSTLENTGKALETSPLKEWVSDSLRHRIHMLYNQVKILAINPAPKTDALSAFNLYLSELSDVGGRVREFVKDVDYVIQKGNIDEIINIRPQVEKLLAEVLDLPTKVTLSYKWKTPVQAYPGGSGSVFEPEDDRTLSISAVTTIDPLKSLEPEAKIIATLSAFKINLLGSAPFLSIRFEPLRFTAGSGQKADLTVKIRAVEFREQLSFVKTIQEYLKKNFGVDVTPWGDGPGVVVTYAFAESSIPIGTLTLQNISFTISCILPFNNSPARFRFGLGEASKPFLVSALPYGGGGYVAIQAFANRIEFLEFSFEYGLVTPFKFGPATGTGRVTVGIYIRLASGRAIVSGFFNASGNADIAGLISIDAMFRVQIWYYPSEGIVRGQATFRISFRIAIVSYGYDVTVDYARQGEKQSEENSETGAQPAKMTQTPMPILRAAGGQPDTGIVYGGSQTEVPHEQFKRNVSRSSNSIADKEVDLAQCLLRDEVWQEYWAAFEEEFNECR